MKEADGICSVLVLNHVIENGGDNGVYSVRGLNHVMINNEGDRWSLFNERANHVTSNKGD